MLKKGDYLIPEKYQYSYEVDKISLKGYWPEGHMHVVCTRWDIDEDRNPVREHRGDGHILILRNNKNGTYEIDNPYGGILKFHLHEPEQYDLFMDQPETSNLKPATD